MYQLTRTEVITKLSATILPNTLRKQYHVIINIHNIFTNDENLTHC